MDWVDGGAGRLRVEKTGAGAGTPVLLVHGGGADRSHWHALLPLLATDRTVVAYDQCGYGESAPPRDGHRALAEMASDVVAVASGTGLGSPVVVGHSYGGAVAAEAVARFADRFSGAVFLDPAGDVRGLPEEELSAWRASMAPERFRASSRAWFERILDDARPETRQHVLATLGLTPRETYVGSMESMLRFDPTVIRRFPGPKLLITVRTFDGPLSMRSAVPEVPNVFIEDTSHWPQLDQPEEVASLVRRFLADVDRRRA
jgi:pimeloyl-ACP methyl ester carboxylesterase